MNVEILNQNGQVEYSSNYYYSKFARKHYMFLDEDYEGLYVRVDGKLRGVVQSRCSYDID